MSFEQPWALSLLALLPLFAVLARWSRSGLERGRAMASTILRTLLFAALVLSLAEARWISTSHRTATMFLLDHSLSVPMDVQSRSLEWVKDQLSKLPKDDRAGVIVFGGESMIEISPSDRPALTGPHSVVTRAATDIGAALRLALAVFPEGYQRRIVLLSDGNENRGHALAEAELARAHGAVIDVFPLRYDYADEVWVEALRVPSNPQLKEPFEVSAVVNAQRAGPARLAFYRNGALLALRDVELAQGKNVFTIPQKIEASGLYAYQAVVEKPGDGISQNNEASGVAAARGGSRVAVIPGEAVDAETLVPALRQEGLEPVVVAPESLTGLADLAMFDAIVLANIEAAQLPAGVMPRMEAAVHDAGVGFIMIGGEKSYGPGGYRGTPIEDLLPVTMEQPQRRVLPNGALCLILHTCEIPDGNFWAKEIGLAALNVLTPYDFMGVLNYGMGGESWVFEMQTVTDKPKLANLIQGASPGDMPSFDATLRMAHKGLSGVKAASKHIVIISDADPSGPSQDLVDAIVADRITISTVAIFPHGRSDIEKMATVAAYAKGRFYHVTDPSKLPQIFTKEAATLQRSMIIEGTIPPVVLARSEAIKGIAPAEIPPLHGYVLTATKPLAVTSLGAPIAKKHGDTEADQFDALLVEWTHGLGRTLAFTSDAKPRWAQDWVPWEHYRKFWSQAVRSVLRTVPRAPFAVDTEIQGGKGRIIVDAVDEQGRFLHTLEFAGSVTGPRAGKANLAFRQTGPGRYEAEFEAEDPGLYTVTASFAGAHDEKGYITQGVPLSYAAEYRDLRTNAALLDRLRELTGGRRLSAESPVYAPLPLAAGIATPLWPFLLALVLALFPVDIFIRRVAVEWKPLARRAWTALSLPWKRPLRRPAEMPATIHALARRKEEVRVEQLQPATTPVELDEVAGSPRPLAPAEAGPKSAPPAAATPSPEPADEYMRRLLEAKKKAKEK
ncbi:MAG: VWA domain-containing protein [Planctomycetes bacterium]|nr:VWA domain-containing protein [Planctomycetota bacterium]